MAWFKKIQSSITKGLSKSSTVIGEGITNAVIRRKLDAQALDEMEEALIAADIGIQAAGDIREQLAKKKFDKDVQLPEILENLAGIIAGMLKKVEKPLEMIGNAKPCVIVMAGVNGNGKTTTLGKMAARFKEDGKQVMIAACDTFRAAAVEQLQEWGKRAGVEVIAGEPNADPASVAFRALEEAKKARADILLLDTAGRLQNKSGLMEELQKTLRVLKKLDADAPHHVLLVLDATTGQNAHSQVEIFKKDIDVTGLIITKLDGTAKGGVAVALAEKFGLPIHLVGVGEQMDDLQSFDANFFARGLVGLKD